LMDDNLKNTELNALISLLDEPDDVIFGSIRDRLFAYGEAAIPLLEDAWDTSYDDNNLQQRIESIIHDIQFDSVFKDIEKWKQSPEQDLITGFMIIARYQYPELNQKVMTDKVGKIIQDVWLELNNDLTPLEKVKVLNHIIFDVHGFASNKTDLHEPKNTYLNTLLEMKKGNALSLSIVYMAVSQSLKIPVYGINLPQNFIMAYMDKMIAPGENVKRSNVLFYINAFNGGAVFTQREIDLFLRQINLENEEKYFLPCDNVAIVRRAINNLIVGYQNQGNIEKSEELKKLQQALN
jgi:regulator of sirC expression with transglutaminase-like and TPR domain